MTRCIYRRGFTLIEMLVAAVILFMAVTSGLLVYKASLDNNIRIQKRYEMMTMTEMAVGHIKTAIRKGQQSGTARLGEVSLRWNTEIIRRAAPPSRFDPNVTEFVSYKPRYQLHDVNVVMTNGEYRYQFSYKEVAWPTNVAIQ